MILAESKWSYFTRDSLNIAHDNIEEKVAINLCANHVHSEGTEVHMDSINCNTEFPMFEWRGGH